MNATLQVDHTVGRGRAHARGADWVVESKGLFIHEAFELLVSDLVDVTAGVRPPVRGRVIVHGDGFKEFLESWASHDLETNAQRGHKYRSVIVALVAEILWIDNCWNKLVSFSEYVTG